MKKRQNKFALITGSGRGLGKELALVFASNNYDIILHDRTENDLKEIEEKVSQKDINYSIVVGDLKSDKTLDDLYRVSKERRLSVLINNAGVHCPGVPFEKIDDSQIDNLLLTNLPAPLKLTGRYYLLFLTSGQGRLININ